MEEWPVTPVYTHSYLERARKAVKNVKNGVFAVRPAEIRFGCSSGKLRKYFRSRFLRNQQEMNRSMLLRIHSQYL